MGNRRILVFALAIAAGPVPARAAQIVFGASPTPRPAIAAALMASDPARVSNFAGGAPLSALADGGSVLTVARRLGHGYWPARDLHVSPYLELQSHLPGTWVAEIDPTTAAPIPSGQALAGAMAGYDLAPLWEVSFDLAAGLPMVVRPGYRRDALATEGEDNPDGRLAWRTGVALHYALGRKFSAFSGVWAHSVHMLGPLLMPQRDLPQSEASVRFGLTYRFQ